jgi:hypothetical protein
MIDIASFDMKLRESMIAPCARIATFEDRCAYMVDRSLCDSDHNDLGRRFFLKWGHALAFVPSPYHRAYKTPSMIRSGDLQTDSPAEATAAWKRAERYVLTGERRQYRVSE